MIELSNRFYFTRFLVQWQWFCTKNLRLRVDMGKKL